MGSRRRHRRTAGWHHRSPYRTTQRDAPRLRVAGAFPGGARPRSQHCVLCAAPCGRSSQLDASRRECLSAVRRTDSEVVARVLAALFLLCMALGGALGDPLNGGLFDLFVGYRPLFVMMAAYTALACVAVQLVQRVPAKPKRPYCQRARIVARDCLVVHFDVVISRQNPVGSRRRRDSPLSCSGWLHTRRCEGVGCQIQFRVARR